MTLEQLARELGVSAKTLRAWLRRNFPTPAAQKHSNWNLGPEQIAAARAWRAGRDRHTPPTTTNRQASTTPAWAGQPKIQWDVRFERSFRRQRFCGFVLLGDAVADRHRFLRGHQQDLVSADVYAIFAPSDWAPTWKTRGPWANVINPWSLARLCARWVNAAELVYIGCAGATASSRTLHNRIETS